MGFEIEVECHDNLPNRILYESKVVQFQKNYLCNPFETNIQ